MLIQLSITGIQLLWSQKGTAVSYSTLLRRVFSSGRVSLNLFSLTVFFSTCTFRALYFIITVPILKLRSINPGAYRRWISFHVVCALTGLS